MSISILLPIAIVLLIVNVSMGFKMGMVKKIISIVSLIIAAIVVVLLSVLLSGYLNGEFINIIVALLMLSIIFIIRHFLGVVFFSAKLITKIPLIKDANKLLGIVLGFAETIIIIWIVYAIVTIFGIGDLGTKIMELTAKDTVMAWLNRHNLIIQWLAPRLR